jgi:cytochrome oxidase Cu insertion factor (SCO1/SenC/PrrC family)
LPADRGPLLITVSVNPDRDTPAKLNAWRAKFKANSRWVALRLDKKSLSQLQRQLGEQDGPPSAHSTDLFVFDKTGKLTARLTGLPSADRVAEKLLGME